MLIKKPSTLTTWGSTQTGTGSNFAQVSNSINKYEPKVVAFDFFFRTAKDEETDKAFQEALAK
ncbi:MAG: hypothetical protein U0519_03660 [Candidatus Gracilibacteria bacterium]